MIEDHGRSCYFPLYFHEFRRRRRRVSPTTTSEAVEMMPPTPQPWPVPLVRALFKEADPSPSSDRTMMVKPLLSDMAGTPLSTTRMMQE